MEEEEIIKLQNIIKELLEEYKATMDQVIQENRSVMEQHYSIINVKLDNIQKQTERTNGRVTKNEEELKQLAIADQRHFNSCPNTTKIEVLQKELNQNIFSKKFIARVITINTLILSILGSIVVLILNLKK